VSSWVVGVSASVIFPCTIKSRRWRVVLGITPWNCRKAGDFGPRMLLQTEWVNVSSDTSPAHLCSPEQRAVKWLCARTCYSIRMQLQTDDTNNTGLTRQIYSLNFPPETAFPRSAATPPTKIHLLDLVAYVFYKCEDRCFPGPVHFSDFSVFRLVHVSCFTLNDTMLVYFKASACIWSVVFGCVCSAFMIMKVFLLKLLCDLCSFTRD